MLPEILSRIRHQVFFGCGSTMGSCPDCGHSSRGSNRCSECITRLELEPLVGAYLATEFHASCKRLRSVERRVLEREGE